MSCMVTRVTWLHELHGYMSYIGSASVPCNHATMQPCNHATMQPCNHATHVTDLTHVTL